MAIGGRPKLLAGAVGVNALAIECYGDSVSGHGSNTHSPNLPI